MAVLRVIFATLPLAFIGSVLPGSVVVAAEPLKGTHSHNDYWRQRPLLDALDHGFTSVEADIFLVDGELLVGHEREELQPGKTLEALYLQPLARRVRENGGHVFPDSHRFLLLIDIKTDAAPTYEQLSAVLSKYTDILTSVVHGKVQQRAVTVVISGNRPSVDEMAAADVRYAGLDGRISDLGSDVPAHLMPMISDNWTSHFSWKGNGPMPADEREKLLDIVERSHAARRVVRFWATPENENVWRELRLAGVDLLNTDQLARLAEFLRAADFQRDFE
jgi:hypothetical protein